MQKPLPAQLGVAASGVSVVPQAPLVSTDVQAMLNELAVVARRVQSLFAAGTPGFLTDTTITDPSYPFTAQNAAFTLGTSGTNVTVSASGPVCFTDFAFNESLPILIEQAAANVNITSFAASFTTGIGLYYLGVNRNGVYSFSPTTYAQNPTIAQLGLVAIAKTGGGVVSFLAGLASPVLAKPCIFRNSNLLRTVAELSIIARLFGTAATLNLNYGASTILGECVGWGTATPHSRTIAAANTVPFRYMTPTTMAGTTLPATVTVLDVGNYWNGSAVAVVPGGANVATIQRVLMTITGALYVQYGSVVYTTLANAVAGADVESFPQIFPTGFAKEIARIAVIRTATDLTSTTQANIINHNI